MLQALTSKAKEETLQQLSPVSTMTAIRLLTHCHERARALAARAPTDDPTGRSRHRPATRAPYTAVIVAALLSLAVKQGQAANTEPTFALTQATVARGSGGRATLVLEGSFGLADAVQLALPLDVVVTQGALTAHFDLAGNVSVSVGGAAAQPASGPGVLGVTSRTITLVLPAEFAAGEASAQIVGTYDGESISSNQLQFTL